MADAAPTIPSLKGSFINAQTNILSRPLVPSRIWRRNNNASSTPIPSRVLDDVLFNLNQTIQLHQRLKKWKESESSIGRELDLAADDAIEELPSSRPIESDLGRYQEKAKQYEGIVLRLTQLSEERKEIRLRVEKLRRIRDAVQRLSATDESNIQDNLVTRNGPVEKEQERMRVLLARVTSRVANLPEQPASDRPQSITSSTVDLGEMTRWGKRKIDSFLADPRVFPP
ncbi:hypothetical protein MAJ_08720, partial [Metarhizium majus ARSEF 297]